VDAVGEGTDCDTAKAAENTEGRGESTEPEETSHVLGAPKNLRGFAKVRDVSSSRAEGTSHVLALRKISASKNGATVEVRMAWAPTPAPGSVSSLSLCVLAEGG